MIMAPQRGLNSIPRIKPPPEPATHPSPFHPFPSSLSPGEREEGKGSWGEGSCGNLEGQEMLTPATVKLVLPPRQSRGISQRISDDWRRTTDKGPRTIDVFKLELRLGAERPASG
jgi:hypothetical protein